jgi:tetratricopeptide (TPR) repeat protein
VKVILLALAWILPVIAEAQVTASSTSITLPTYLEGLPDPNPPFEQLVPSWATVFYPYTWRTVFTEKKVNHAWRADVLENQYLKCTFLPDLGGHVYSCIDKLNGKEMFYANSCVKKSWVALRGAFAALGVEFNFPAAHSWVTVSRVDSAIRHNPDGSATVVLSSIDRVDGMLWRVDATLRPGVDYLEQKVTLYNRSDVRHGYQWWSNAAVHLDDDSTSFVLPTALVATHFQASVDRWPVNSKGIDLSVAGNIKAQTGLFAAGSREPFLAVYQAHSRTGTIHYADADQLSGKKIWAWGTGLGGNDRVRKDLSDDGSTYVEIQAGLTKDQETWLFLEPQQIRTFTEYWLQARDLGGISRANLYAAVYLQRSAMIDGKVDLTLETEFYRHMAGVTIRVLDGQQEVLHKVVDADPVANVVITSRGLSAMRRYRVQIADRTGKILLTHSEGPYDALTAEDYEPTKHAPDDALTASEAALLATAEQYESNGRLNLAYAECQRALRAYPDSVPILKAAGRTSVVMNRFAEGGALLERARTKAGGDAETRYYLGLAYAKQDDDARARTEFSAVPVNSSFAGAARLQIAASLSRAGQWADALTTIREVENKSGSHTRAGAMEVALLRHLGRSTEAKSRLAFWRSIDPSDLFLRFEGVQLNARDPLFYSELATDPERVLNIVTQLFELGFYEDSLALTDHKYPVVDPLDTEPGAVLPQEYPLVAYYRGYARERLGQVDFFKDYQAASRLSSLYVFPSRPGSLAILRAASTQNPDDATAHALLGSLYFSFRMTNEAINEWQMARAIRKDLPALQRDLGRALLEAKKDNPAAVEVLQEGRIVDPENQEITDALQKAQSQVSNSRSSFQ